MARAMFMKPKIAVQQIAQALINLSDDTQFEHRKFPYSSTDIYSPDKPSLMVRWTGIAEDLAVESETILTPSAMRFDIRIINLYSYGPKGVADSYVHAQNNVQNASMDYFEALNENRHLDGLVLDIGIDSSIVDDLVDPISEEIFYGHEKVITVKIWN